MWFFPSAPKIRLRHPKKEEKFQLINKTYRKCTLSRRLKTAGNAFLWHISGKHLVRNLFERYSFYQKSSEAKNLSDIDETGDLGLSLIKLHYSKKWNFGFNDTKNNLHHKKEHKKTAFKFFSDKSFSIFRKAFELYAIKYTFSRLALSSFFRDFGLILIFKTKVTRKQFKK